MNKRKRLLALICVALMTSEFLPTQVIANATLNLSEVKVDEELANNEKLENSESTENVVLEENKSNDTGLEGEKPETKVEENKPVAELKNSIFTFFIKEKNSSKDNNKIKEFLSFKFNRETNKFEMDKNIEKDFSINKDENSTESNNESNELLEIKVIDSENKEKLDIKLLDNHDNSEELKKLLELEIKETDYIQINILNTDLNLKIEDDIYGDITKEKEDYSDGVSTLDYINNVRFQIKKEGINTIYNEAPVINGVNDIEVDSENKDALLQGISVTDDHDEIQNSSIQVSSKKLEENKTMVTYSVKDSWGRVTSANRTITYISSESPNETEEDVSSLNLESRTSTTPASLSDVVFTVKGVRYSNGKDERFKIKFDTNKKLIKVTDMDMRIMNTNDADEYFRFELYDSKMNLKKEVVIRGNERSEAANALNNVPYEIGDYIYVYHKESQSKLYMNGVTNQGNENYSNGVQFKPKTERRFKITNSGLEIVTNTAPTLNVTGFENESQNLKKTIKRGDTINLTENVTYSDEFDSQNNIPLTLFTSEFNNMKLGEQTVIYAVSDSWGATTTKEVKVKVEPKNDLEQVKFKFYSKGSTEELFNMTIDSVNHKIEVNRVSNNNQAIKGYSGAAFKIKIIDGVSKKVKREIAIRGNETGFSSTLDRLDGYSYNDGDRISVWALNSEDIKIDGDSKIEAKPGDVSYSNGISDRDHIDNVRFEMNGDKLKYIHNNEPQFTFTGDLSVVRGEELNITSGVSINDDHDGEVKDLSTVKVINFDKYKLGEQTVTYQYTDSWGRTGTAIRKVTVLPKNKLEQNYVKFYTDNTNDSILKISFDDITGKLKFEDATTGTINGISEEVIRIRTYRDGKKVRDLPIKGNASGIQIKNAIEALNIDYKYGDTIEFVSTDSNKLNRVRIFGDVIKNTNNKEDARETEQLPSEGDTSSSVSKNGYEDGFKTADEMQNTRFKLTTDGLEAIYNSAPEFIGLTDLKVIKGETPDFKSGVTVKDDIDNISIDEVTINSDGFNSNVVNVYGVTYTVTDSWGRTTSKVRNVRVVSKVENNIISLDGDNNNKLFEIGFDTVTNKLTFNKIELNSESGSDSTVGGGAEEQSPPGLEENNSFRVALNENTDNKVFEIKVFNEQMTQVGVATLNNDYNYEEFKEQLEKINMYESYYVSLWSKESNKLKINGSVNKDDSNITEENYADGISSEDQMINVRFESTEDGLRAVYNSAPVISMLTSSTSETQPQAINDSIPELTRFSHYLGETYKLTENMKVTDDKDTNISVEDITATSVKKVVSSENTTTPEPSEGSRTTLESGQETTEDSSGNNGTTETVKNPVPTEVGTYIVTYTVTDSWGRESKATRELTIKNGIERHEITFRGHERIGNTNNYNDITAFSLKFNHIENSDKVSISVVAKDKPISDRYVNNGGLENFYNIKVLDENDRVVKNITLNARDNPKRYDRLIELSREEFQYGYKIKIGAFQTPGLSILGEILGDVKEDYSDGVGNKMNVEYVTFELTKEGLKAKYVDSDLNTSIKNVITNLDFGGIQAFKINYDISDNGENSQFIGKLHISDRGGQIKYEDRSHSLTIRLVRKNENTIEQRFIGTDNGNDSKFNSFNDKYVKEGDYIEFWAKAPDRLFITGNAIDKVNNHDYTLGGSKELFANTRFYFTSQGIEPKYNKAPQITADAIDVYQGDTSFNLTNGVKVTDDHDDINADGTLKENTNTPSTVTSNTTPRRNVLSYTVNSDSRLEGDSDTTINTNTLGERTVTYTYTDSWGRTGTTTRKVVVRPNLYKNRIKVYAEESDNLKARTASNTNENVGGDNSVGDSENSGDINQDSTVETNKKEPAFEIGFNTLTRKYEVLNKKDEYLDVRNPRKDIFSIQIKAADGRIKFSETLQGNDKGTTSKLNPLNEVNYEATDIIRVWRAGTEEDSIPFRTSESNKPILVPNLKITGDIIKESNGDVNIDEDYSDGINNLDFMNNVGFKPENGGLKAIYNKAPEINGFNESDVKVVVKGTNLNLRDGISVNDDKDNPNTLNNFTVSPNTIDTSELGTHKITYTVTDSWNRTTRKVRTIKVVSKVENNAIEVYKPNEDNFLLFKIDFDANNKKFIINGTISNNNQQNNSQDGQTENDLQESRTGETPPSTENSSEESNEGKIFRIKIFDSNGNIVVNSSVANTEEMTLESIKSQLKNLINYTFNIGDSISIWSSNADKVKIKGNIQNNSKNYEDGLGSKMDEVRFKITENGLQEITATTPVITFDEGDNSVEVKRGGEISYLAGVSVSDESENVPISKVTYTVNSTGDNSNNNNSIDTSVLGEKTVTYKVTNSWGKTVTKVRKYNIVHKNEIDAVRLNFKSKNNESNYLEVGFDEITKKLHIYKNPTEALYSEESDNVLSISVYDSNGNTTETLQIVGNQVIPEEQVNRINDLPYTEGMYIGIETKYPEKLSITGNITHSDKQNQFYTNVDFSNGIQESEKDALENTRFKIGSTQIEAVYNEAPVINYPGKNDNSKNNGRIIVKKGEIYDYNKDLTVIDDHDGSIEATNVGVDESLVNYDQVGLYNITYIVTDSWGRDGTVTRPVQIVSNIVGNEINVYSRNTNENTSEGTGTEDEQIENINDENVGSSDGSSSEGSSESGSTGDSNGSNDSIGDSSNGSETTTQLKGRVFTIGFKEEVVSENNIKIKLEVKNKNNIAIDSSRENQVAIKIVAYNKEGKEISGKNLSLNGNITGNSQELNQLESWELEYGDYISLYASDLDEEVSGNNSQIVEDENVDIINMKSSESSTEGSNEPEDTTETPNVPVVPEESSKKEPVTSMLRITGGVVNAKEDYSSGNVKKDNIVNVRFEVTDWGLEALYNEAPIINIKEVEGGLSKYLGETYEITEGVTVYDEIDGDISADKIETSFKLISESVNNQGNGQQQEGSTRISDNNSSTDTNSSESDSENDDIDEGKGKPKKHGRYLLTYTVADSWGRTSSKTRNIEIKPGMNRHEISFRGHESNGTTNGYRDITSFTLKFKEEISSGISKIKIDIEGKDQVVSNRVYATDFYVIEIISSNSNNSRIVNVGGQSNPMRDSNIQGLKNIDISYGDKIKIIAKQTPGLSIRGEILGDVFEDYSDGVQNRYNLDKVIFTMTKDGLVAEYSDSQISHSSQNMITSVEPGGLNPFIINVKTKTSMNETDLSRLSPNSLGKLQVTTKGEEIIWMERGTIQNAMTIKLVRANGTVELNKTFTSEKANIGENSTNFTAFNNKEVYNGDYLEITHQRPSFIHIMGNPHPNTNAKVDYREGAKDEDNLNNVRFYFKDNSENPEQPILMPVYNEAPEITGMNFQRVPVNTSYDLLEGVETSDQIDDALNKKVKLVIKNDDLGINETITQNATKNSTSNGIRSIFNKLVNNTNSSESNINDNQVIDMTAFNYKFDKSGIFNIEYTMTDSWGRTTTEYRTIQVYGSPEIEPKKDVVQNETTEQGEKVGTVTVELNSMKDNIEAYMESYFRSLVSISDVEDDDKDLKVEIEGEVKPDKVGTYPVNYKVTDTHGNITMYKINVNVVKTIKATVTTDIPFQVVTNLLKENGTAENIEDRFVSSKIRIKNNNPNSKMEVYVKGLNKSEGDLELVNGDNFEFNSLNKFEALRKMALGLYFIERTNVGDENIGEGENSELPTETTKVFTKASPLWLTTDMAQTKITTMNEASGNKHDITLPSKNNSDTGTAQPPEGGDSEEGDEEQPSSRTDSSDQEGENPPSSTEEDENLKNPNYYIKDYGTVEGKVLEFGLTAKYGNNFAGGKVRGKFKLIFEFR